MEDQSKLKNGQNEKATVTEKSSEVTNADPKETAVEGTKETPVENKDDSGVLDQSQADQTVGEDDNEANDDDENVNEQASRYVKIIGFKRPTTLDEELKLYYRFFTNCVEVGAPSVQIPGPTDKWIYFELKSLDDRTKLFKYTRKGAWEGQKLFAKAVTIKVSAEYKDLKKMTIEEGLEILYPNRDILYSQQLKTKHEIAKETIEQLIPKEKVEQHIQTFKNSKRFLKAALKVREMVPMRPFEGYENNVTVIMEEDEESGEITHGIRVVSEGKESAVIVPLDQCISVPREMKIVSKAITQKLIDFGLKPYAPSKKGDVLGFTLRMSAFGGFMMTLMVSKVYNKVFKQLTPEGVVSTEGESEEAFSVQLSKRMDEIKEKLKNFYSEVETTLGIEGVYLVMSNPNSLIINSEDSTPTSTHVFGHKLLVDKLNGINLRLGWDRDRHVEVFQPMLSLIEASGQINSSSRIYLISPYRPVGLYFAKKCAHVTMLYSWTKDNMVEFNQAAKQAGINNIEFLNAKSQFKKTFPKENAVAISWQFSKPLLIERFLLSEFTNMIFLSYWFKNSQNLPYLNTYKKMLESVYSRLRIYSVCPFDVAPYKNGYGIAVFFNGMIKKSEIRGKIQGNAPTVTNVPNAKNNKPGKDNKQNTKAQANSQVSPFKRLGPVPFPRPVPSRSMENSTWRSNVWRDQHNSQPAMGNTLKQLDEVASGVMLNLQAVQQQMQAFIPSLLQKNQPQQENNLYDRGWNNKRRYNDVYPEENTYNKDQYSSHSHEFRDDNKRRRTDYGYDERYQSNDNGTRYGNNFNAWGDEPNIQPRKEVPSTYGPPPDTWKSNFKGQDNTYYDRGHSNNSFGTNYNNSSYGKYDYSSRKYF